MVEREQDKSDQLIVERVQITEEKAMGGVQEKRGRKQGKSFNSGDTILKR
jgi:hypothetical protein